MELLDIYDANGTPTGQTAERGALLPSGYYFLCAHIIIENREGLFLIQQRSDQKKTRPGKWDITAGAVDAGESSLDGALREAKEEIGLQLIKEEMTFWFRDCKGNCFHDVWYIRTDFRLTDCRMQKSEVQALKMIPPEKLLEMVNQMPHRSANYKKMLTLFLQNRK